MNFFRKIGWDAVDSARSQHKSATLRTDHAVSRAISKVTQAIRHFTLEALEQRQMLSGVIGPSTGQATTSYTLTLDPSGVNTPSWNINWGDSRTSTATATDTSVSHTYATAGAFAPQLSATDSAGKVHPTSLGLNAAFGSGTGKVVDTSLFPQSVGFSPITQIVQRTGGLETMLLVGGWGTSPAGRPAFTVFRYHLDGSIDTTFGDSNGQGAHNGSVQATFGGEVVFITSMALDSQNRIVTVGQNPSSARFDLARFTADGQLDSNFGTSGIVETQLVNWDNPAGVVIGSDDSLYVGGSTALDGAHANFLVAHFMSTGVLDTNWGDINPTTGQHLGYIASSFTGNFNFSTGIAITPSGKLVLAGWELRPYGWNFGIARYNINGTPDTSFNGTGATWTTFDFGNNGANAVAVQPDGKIVAAGQSAIWTSTGTRYRFALARYNDDGSLDTTLGGAAQGDGQITTFIGTGDSVANAVAIQPDGKILAAGVSTDGTHKNFTLARYNGADGSLDGGFGTGGVLTTNFTGDSTANGLVLLPTGGSIAVGAVTFANGQQHLAMARYLTTNQVTVEGSQADPTGLSAVNALGTVRLTWSAPAGGAASYKVYRSTHSGFLLGADTLLGTSTTPSYHDITSAAGTPYYYRVTALDASANESAPTPEVSVTTTGIAQNAILDGGFEDPRVGIGWGAVATQPTTTAWAFAGTSGVVGNQSQYGNQDTPDGHQAAFVQGVSSLSQTVHFLDGNYVIGFVAAQRAANNTAQNLEVWVDDQLIGQTTPGTTEFRPYVTAPFHLTAGDHVVRIKGVNTAGGDNTAFVDDVMLGGDPVHHATATPGTPPPSSGNATAGGITLSGLTESFYAARADQTLRLDPAGDSVLSRAVSGLGLNQATLQGDPALASLVNHEFQVRWTGTLNVTADGTYGFKMPNAEGAIVTIDGQAWIYRPSELGDVTLDGTTDISDLDILLANYLRAGNWNGANFDGSGTVAIADLNSVLSNYFQTPVPGVIDNSNLIPAMRLTSLLAGTHTIQVDYFQYNTATNLDTFALPEAHLLVSNTPTDPSTYHDISSIAPIVTVSPVQATTGEEFSGEIATFTAAAFGTNPSDYSVSDVLWSDGSSAADGVGVYDNGDGTFSIYNTHTFPRPGHFAAPVTVTYKPSGVFSASVDAFASVPDRLLFPTVATAAAAGQSVVTGTTDTLSVLGALAGGNESDLIYAWSVTSGKFVTFSDNYTNTAKSTSVTFSAAGTYALHVTISNGTNTVTSDVSVTVQQTLTSLTVSPSTADVLPDATRQITAVAYDQFGGLMNPVPTFAWSVISGRGTVDGNGLYTAPSDTGSATVQAATGGFSGQSQVTVSQGSSYQVTLTGRSYEPDYSAADSTGDLTVAHSGWITATSPEDAVQQAVSGTVTLNTSYDHGHDTLTFPTDLGKDFGFGLLGDATDVAANQLTWDAANFRYTGAIGMWDGDSLAPADWDFYWNLTVVPKPTVSLTPYRTGGNFGTAVSKAVQKAADPHNYAILANTDVIDPTSGNELTTGYTTAPIQGNQVVATNGNAPDHNLARISLDLSPLGSKQGTVQISLSNPSAVRLFKSDGTEFYDQSATGSSPLTVDLSNPSGYLAGLRSGTVDLWIEGLVSDPNFVMTVTYTGSVATVSDNIHIDVIAITYKNQAGANLDGVKSQSEENLLAAANEYSAGGTGEDTTSLRNAFQANLSASEFQTVLKGIDPSNVTQLTEGDQVLSVGAGPDSGSAATSVELVDGEGLLDTAGIAAVGQQIGGKVVPIYAPIVLKTVMDVLTDVLPANHDNAQLNFFFDGTGNNGLSDGGMETNVYGMKLEDIGHESHYLTGVGATDNGRSKGFDKVFAAGLSAKEDKAWDWLIADLKENPNRTINIVGFSRGSAEAVDFANRIANGLKNGSFVKKDKKKRAETEEKVTADQTKIQFLGLFDLVTTMGGMPGSSIGLMEKLPAGLGLVAHAVALSEERLQFEFTDMSQLNPNNVTLDQIGFRGAHSDIGGGYGDQQLTSVTMAWMNGEAQKAGWTTLDTSKLKINKTVRPDLNAQLYNGLSVHDEATAHPLLFPDRQYRNFSAVAKSPLQCWQPGNGWEGQTVPLGNDPTFWDPNFNQIPRINKQIKNGA